MVPHNMVVLAAVDAIAAAAAIADAIFVTVSVLLSLFCSFHYELHRKVYRYAFKTIGSYQWSSKLASTLQIPGKPYRNSRVEYGIIREIYLSMLLFFCI